MRIIALDVYRSFAQTAILENGKLQMFEDPRASGLALFPSDARAQCRLGSRCPERQPGS